MKKKLLLIVLIWSSPGQSQTAEEGNYIVVRGAIIGCNKPTGRVLDVVLVDGFGVVSLVGIPNIKVKSLDGNNIKSKLLDAIESKIGNRPESVEVSVLTTIEESLALLKERDKSLEDCVPSQNIIRGNNTKSNQGIDIEIRRAKLFELLV